MEYLWGLGITEPQLVSFEVATDEFFSVADAAQGQAVLQRHGARGFAVSAAVMLQMRRKSIFARSVHALRVGCVGQIWSELELYCCCGTAMLVKLFVLVWFVLKLYFLGKKKKEDVANGGIIP